MSAILGEVGGFLDKYLIGYALGTAAGPALAPFAQELANEAWRLNAVRPPEAVILAAGVAQGQVTAKAAYAWAKETGFDKDQMDALVNIANTGPPLAQAMALLRRGVWTPDQYKTALNRMAIETEWYPGLLTLEDERLSPAELAVMVQRGIVANDGLLPVGPPTEVGKVPPMPMIAIDPLVEAKANGINQERLAGLARIIGLPASPDLAARMVFRGIIDRVDFDRAISEGNTRNEWAPFLFDGFRQIPTAHDYIEGQLRDWITPAEMYAGTALHGMSTTDTDLLFKVTGRPASFHQVFIGLRRGGTYDGPVDQIDPAFLKSLHESNIRPEWYNLLWAQRFVYPSAFVLKALTAAGELTQQEAEQVLLYEGWEPTFAAKVSAAWAKAPGAAVKPKTLTAAQIRTAWKDGAITLPDALTRLEALGYSAADAQIFMTPSPAATTAG